MSTLTEAKVRSIQAQLDITDVEGILEEVSCKLFAPPSGERAALLYDSLETAHVASRLRGFIATFESATGRVLDAILCHPSIAETVADGVVADIFAKNPQLDFRDSKTRTTYILREEHNHGSAPIEFHTTDQIFNPGVPLIHHDRVPEDVLVLISGGFFHDPFAVSVSNEDECGIVLLVQPQALYASVAG